jgi:hypothetical protein
MTFLPIVERELRVAARLPATFRNRALTAGIVAAVAVLMMLFASMTSSPAFIGGTAFIVLSVLTLCFCLLEGVRKTADCLSEERREGTLGLLFLTDLKGYDIVFGKLAATSLNSFYGLVAILPVLALPLLLGGVTPGEYWRMALALLNILFFSLCAGMWVSSRSFQQQPAAGGTLLVIILFSAIPWLTLIRALHPLSPVCAFYNAFDANYPHASHAYWESLGVTQFWSWMLLAGASLAAPRMWQDNEAQPPGLIRRPRRGWRLRPMESREKMLAINPVLWLAARQQNLGSALHLTVLIALAGAAVFAISSRIEFLPVYLGFAVLLNFLPKILLATQAANFFAEARRENALETLLATPLSVEQIINGQLLALERLFFAPFITIFLLEVGGAMAGIFLNGLEQPQRGNADALALLVPGGIAYLVLFCADAFAVVWAGMWFGLTCKKESQAATMTVLWVVVAPLVALMLWCPGYIYCAGSSVFWIFWARARLYNKLREVVGTRYGLKPVDPYPQPASDFVPPKLTPPIIKP